MKATYHDVIRENAGIPLETDEEVKQSQQKQEDNVIKRTLKVQWQQEAVTVEMFQEISREITKLETRARELACGYAVNQNHLEIINLLVRASELRNIKNTYGSHS